MPSVTPSSGLGNAPTTQFFEERRESSNSITLEAKRPRIGLGMRLISDPQTVENNCAVLLESVLQDKDEMSFSEKVRTAIEEMAGPKNELTEMHIANMADMLAEKVVQMDDNHIQWTINALDNIDFRKQVVGNICEALLKGIHQDQDETSFRKEFRTVVERMNKVEFFSNEHLIETVRNRLVRCIGFMGDQCVRWVIDILGGMNLQNQVEDEMSKLREALEKLPPINSLPSGFSLRLKKDDEKIRNILKGESSGDLDGIIGELYVAASTDPQKFRLLLQTLEDIEKDFFKKLEELQQNFSDTTAVLIECSLEHVYETEPFNEIAFETCFRQLKYLQSSSMADDHIDDVINGITDRILSLLEKNKQWELKQKVLAIMSEEI